MTSLTVPIFVPLGSPLASSSTDGAAAALVSNGTSIAGGATAGAGVGGTAAGAAWAAGAAGGAVSGVANAAKLHTSNMAIAIHKQRFLRFQNFISCLLAIANLSSISRPPDGLRSELPESQPD